MNKIKLDTFMDFRMLSSLTFSPNGEKLAYVLTGIDREKKEYVSRLRLRTGDDDRLMVSDGKIGEFYFEDEDHLLFVTDRKKLMKSVRSRVGGFTEGDISITILQQTDGFLRMTLAGGGEGDLVIYLARAYAEEEGTIPESESSAS